MKTPITLISIGKHTRLGDVLEQALEGLPFRTLEAEELAGESAAGARLLFAVSADAHGENEQLRQWTTRLIRGDYRLDGAACALIADGEQGGTLQADALRLLLSASNAGASCISQPLLESRRDLKPFSGAGEATRRTPFDAYVAKAMALTKRLSEYETDLPKRPRVRLLSPLTGGTAKDWRSALTRILTEYGAVLTEDEHAQRSILLAENTSGLPDERTLALLRRGSGRLTCLVASPAAGSELYSLALLDQACVRGGYSLAPEGMLIFEGMSAIEVLASKAELERVKQALLETVRTPDSK